MSINIPKSKDKRVVIVGGGFAGLQLAKSLKGKPFQVVLIDKNNYHQFPPLIYQVASSGLEPSSIAFPFRSVFRGSKNVFFRKAEALSVDTAEKKLITSIGEIEYDYLVLASGAKTNYFGNEEIKRHAFAMKTLSEAMHLRNVILRHLEQALSIEDEEERLAYLRFVVVGGGPTGVEIAGALAEMKRYVIPKDYPEINPEDVHILLIDAADRPLSAMSQESSTHALKGLGELGVEVSTGQMVTGYDGEWLELQGGERMRSKTVVWVSGITAHQLEGISKEHLGRGARIRVDAYNQVEGLEGVFALGDQAIMTSDAGYPGGHPQQAQVALQQASLLASNLERWRQGEAPKPFAYRDLGSMATIGRNRAVAEVGGAKWGGFSAWVLWLVVHLRSILSVRNKVIVLLNWIWSYFTYDRSLRLILKESEREG